MQFYFSAPFLSNLDMTEFWTKVILTHAYQISRQTEPIYYIRAILVDIE